MHLWHARFIPKRRAAARRCHQPPREAKRHHRARHMAFILLRKMFRERPRNLLTGFGAALGQRRENAGVQAMRLAVIPRGCDSGVNVRGEGGCVHRTAPIL